MCIADGEAPSASWLTHPTAKKTHKCCECLSEIPPGEKYELMKGVWDGKFGTFKTCMICAGVREKAQDAFNDEGIPFGCLWEIVGVEHE